MGKLSELEQELKELKLRKRELVLAEKETAEIDELIALLEDQLKEENK